MQNVINQVIASDFIKIILSNPVRKNAECKKINIRKVELKGLLLFQAEEFINNKAFHKNLKNHEFVPYLVNHFSDTFKEMNVLYNGYEMQYKNLNGKIMQHKNISKNTRETDLQHNKEKNYIFKEGTFIPPLYKLGIMDEQGRVFKQSQKKYTQINNFISIFINAIKDLNKEKEITILQPCCGKDYLDTLLYYYLHVVNGYKVKTIALDIKADVINQCKKVAKEFGYSNMSYECTDINKYNFPENIDVVLSLHACDTLTDTVLKKAVAANAKVILSVPCCHKEVAGQLKNDNFNFVLQYGIFKDRMSAMVTDAIRAEHLSDNGYKVDVLEFVDFENSPKNIMIRAIKARKETAQNARKLADKLNLNPSILK